MKLPDLSNSMYVAGLRYIQSIHEAPEHRNPDLQVGRFLPRLNRLRRAWIRPKTLSALRADPFYYYLLARTRYYDKVLTDAVALDGVRRIVSVGCGSDTRAYRFKQLLVNKGVRVLECDQAQAIRAKERLTVGWGLDHVDYLPLDLNDGAWPELERRLAGGAGQTTLVLLEGVSPYVDASAFAQFLSFISMVLAEGSYLVYDFKIQGYKDKFGRDGRTVTPFRLPSARDEVASFHQSRGLSLERLELSAELCQRLLPRAVQPDTTLFHEDCLIQLRIDRVHSLCAP
jgi:methyltransferase (TIGR00027 family)